MAPQLVRGFLISEANQKSPATANHACMALRTFFNYLGMEGFPVP